MSEVLLICANAKEIPLRNESVQCVVTSPPYWGLRKYAGSQECGDWNCAFGLEPSLQMYVSHTIEILHEIRRVLRTDGVVFWNVGDSYAGGGNYRGINSTNTLTTKQASNRGANGVHQELGALGKDTGSAKPKYLCLIPQRIAIAAQEDGWWVRSDIIWNKPNPMPESVLDRPTDAYEHILMLTKSRKYYWDKDAIAEPCVSPPQTRDRNAEGYNEVELPRSKFLFSPGARTYGLSGKRNLRNVWTFPTQPYKGAHFAAFPEELPRKCIKAASKAGDVVFDPFGGSGTTAKVALELGRKAVLLDLAYPNEYGKLAQERIGIEPTPEFVEYF